MHLNPDNFLETPCTRWVTPERNAWAWKQCFNALPAGLIAARGHEYLYLLVGAQGSGKTTWARALLERRPRAVVFDAILVKRSERAPIVAAATEYGVPAVAVWFHTALAVCLARNATRTAEELVNEQGLRNVFAALEPPTKSEGFVDIVDVEGDRGLAARAIPARLHPAESDRASDG